MALNDKSTAHLDQYAELEKAGKLELVEPSRRITLSSGTAVIKFALPAHGVSLLRMSLMH